MRLPILLFLLLGCSSYAREQASQEEQEERMQFLIENDGRLQTLFVECQQKHKGSSNLGKEVSDCLWKNLPEKDRVQLREAITKKDIESTEDESLKYVVQDNLSLKRKEDAGFIAYENFLKKHLHEVLYGDVKDRVSSEGKNLAFGSEQDRKVLLRKMDHSDFHTLYESQLGKNIIHAISAYCIEANESDGSIPTSQKDKRENRKKNLQYLSQFDGNGQNKAAQITSKCMNKIPDNCRKDTNPQESACLVMDYIQKAKQAILLTADIKKTWNDRAPSSSKSTVNASEFVDITSAQVAESEMNKEAFKEAQFLEECKTNYMANKARCDEYLVSREDGLKSMVDTQLKRELLISELEKIANEEDEAGFKEYLTEQGYAEARIEEILQGDWQEKINKEVLPLYRNQKDALASSIQAQLSKYEGVDPEKAQDPQAIQNKFLEIQKEITGQESFNGKAPSLSIHSKPEVFKQVIHFSNIISGFIAGEGQGKEFKGNTQALFKELGNSAFGEDANRNTRDVASKPFGGEVLQLNGDHLDQIKRNVKPSSSDDEGTVNIDKNTINDIFGPIQSKKKTP